MSCQKCHELQCECDLTFTDEDLKRARYIIDFVSNTEPPILCNSEIAALLARLEAAESALDSYDKFYHGYDDESLDEYKRWRKAAGR